MTILADTAQDNYLDTFRRKHGSEYPLPFEQFKNFIKKHPKSIYRWQIVHRDIQLLIINSKHRRKEIHDRLDCIFYRESYKSRHNGNLPSENCISRIKRLINNDPYPYKYDYELDFTHKNEILTNLVQYYKIIFQYHFNITKKEHPSIDLVKKAGDVTPSTMYYNRSSQTACTPTRARSKLSSSRNTSVRSRIGDEEDRSFYFSVSRTLTRSLNPKAVVIVKPVATTNTLQAQHSDKLTQIMKSFHDPERASLNRCSDIPGTVNENVP